MPELERENDQTVQGNRVAGLAMPGRRPRAGHVAEAASGRSVTENGRTSSKVICSPAQSYPSEASHGARTSRPRTIQTLFGLTHFCAARQDAPEMEGESTIDSELRGLCFGYPPLSSLR